MKKAAGLRHFLDIDENRNLVVKIVAYRIPPEKACKKATTMNKSEYSILIIVAAITTATQKYANSQSRRKK
jgi:hypothetical protein